MNIDISNYVCIYVYLINTCIYTYMKKHMNVSKYICIYTRAHISEYISYHLCINAHIYIYI